MYYPKFMPNDVSKAAPLDDGKLEDGELSALQSASTEP